MPQYLQLLQCYLWWFSSFWQHQNSDAVFAFRQNFLRTVCFLP